MGVLVSRGAAARHRAAGMAVVLTLTASFAVSIVGTASAHEGCLSNALYGSDANCKAHWQDFHMLYHWGNAIEAAHHDDERARFNSAINRWENVTGPNNPWEVHFNTAADTHVNVENDSGDVGGKGEVAQEDANHHIPRMINLYIRHDIDEVNCNGTPCSWYSQADPDVPNNKVDSWSVWQEETGHAQNISHNGTGCSTMSGTTCIGSSQKRNLPDHQIWHACDPYRRVHDAC